MLDIDLAPTLMWHHQYHYCRCMFRIGHSAVENKQVIGIAKPIAQRWSSGPFPPNKTTKPEKNGAIGHEFGATTGRPRRCGWIDLHNCFIPLWSMGSQVIITKLDVLNDFDEIWAGRLTNTMASLPPNCHLICVLQKCKSTIHTTRAGTRICKVSIHSISYRTKQKTYLTYLENQFETKISMISTGPERSELIVR